MTGEKEFKGYLDRLRENLESLDGAIADARTNAKKKGKDSNSLQWSKQLLNLIQERNATLLAVKTHLLGRDETGAPVEPNDHYEGNDQEALFERAFKNFLLHHWTPEDLKIECQDCHVKSEDVWYYTYDDDVQMYANLCGKCYEKRTTKSNEESKDTEAVAEPASKGDMKVTLQTAALQIKALRILPVDQRIIKLEELLADKPELDPRSEQVYNVYRVVLQEELDKAKAERDQTETSKQ